MGILNIRVIITMHKLYIKFLLAFSFLLVNSSMAQEYSESFWYFGDNSSAVQFNKNEDRSAILINNQALPFANNGAATAARGTNGQLLFYTDGATIYGRNHQLLPGGNLTGDATLRHPVAISPSPIANDELFHVYFITASRGLSYVNVDMSQGVFGEVTSAPIGTGINNLSPFIKTIRVADNFFIIYQTTTNNRLQIAQIGNGGGLTVVNTFDISIDYALNNLSVRSLGQDSAQFALSSENVGGAPKNIILVDLIGGDLSTALFENEQILTNTGAVNQVITDLEWSVGGNNLYYSRNNLTTSEGRIFQFNPDSLSTSNILNRTINQAAALQNGPDGDLYFLYNNGAASFLSSIQFADSIPDSLNIQWNLFNEASFGNAQNLPFASPPQLIEAPISFDWYDTQLNANICQSNPISFFASYNDINDISGISWDFGNGQTSDAISPIIDFPEAGSFNVILEINAGGNIFIDSSTVVVDPFSSEVQLQDTTVCELPLENYGPTLGDGGTPDNITWINPDPEKFGINADGTATFLESGTYSAAVTVGACTVTATFVLTLFEEGKQRANFWYFGDGAGIDFNGDAGPQAVTDGAITAAEGCATVSDDNGDLLFYTNGNVIWDSEHNEMANGEDLGGNQLSSQGVLAVAHGVDPSLYYIFLSEDQSSTTRSFKYALVDMKLNNGLGDVVLKNRKVYSQSLEKIAAVGVGNTTVLTHELGTNNYRAFDVNAEGINSPDYVSEGATFLTDDAMEGYIKYAAGGDKIAHAYNSGGAFIDFLRTDSTGRFEDALIDVNFGGKVYGIEFSPSNNFLYATVITGGTSQIVQIPVNDEYSIEEIESPDSVTVADLSFVAGAIQTGPDGQLYVAANNSGDVYRLGSPDVRVQPNESVDLANRLQPFNLAGRNSRLGLPNFVQNLSTPEQEPSINVIAACSSDPIILQGSGTTNFDVYNWTITPVDSAASVYTSNQQIDTVDVALNPGRYEVVLRITNQCGYDNLLTENIEIFASPDVSQVISPRTFCGNTLTIGENIVDEPGHTYLWSNGETTQTITITEQAIYNVTVTSANGCISTAEIFVGPPFNADLGPDQTVCQDDNLVLNAGANSNTYNWYIDDVLETGANGQSFTVPTDVAGIFMVRVEVPDPLDASCFATDEVEITVNETPTLSSTVTNPTCGASNGVITIVPAGGSGDYAITWTGPVAIADNTLSANGLAAGSYNVTVADNLTGCSVVETIALSNPEFTVAVTQTPNICDEDNQTISVLLAGTFTPNFDFDVLNQQNDVVLSGTGTTNPFDLGPLEIATYSIEVTDNSGAGCLGVAAFTLTPADSVAFNPDPEIFACGTYDLETYLQGITAAGVTFGYSPIPTDPTDISSTQVFTITASDGVNCPTTAEVAINISEAADINNIENTVNCDGGNVLTANLTSGNPADFNFSWSNGAQGQSITVNQPGNYRVSVFPNSNVSCADSASINVPTIYEAIDATLTSETNCEDGTITLLGNISGGSGNYFFRLTNSADVEIPTTDPTSNIRAWNITESDSYTFTVSDQGVGGCDDIIIRRDLTVQDVFQPTIQDTYFICSTGVESERSVTLDPGSYGSYLWTLPNGSTATSRTIIANEPGTYRVVLRAAGCEFTVSTVVLEDCKPKVFAPNAVRPGSGIAQNRTFSVFANDYVGDFQIIIYNRWGTLVYQSKDKDFQWDTTDTKGKAVPQGTYAYIITFKSTDANNTRVYEERGGVTVVR